MVREIGCWAHLGRLSTNLPQLHNALHHLYTFQINLTLTN